MFQSVTEALSYVREHHIHTIDLKVADLSGRWRHVSLPASRCDAELLEQGVPVPRGLLELPADVGPLLLLPDVRAASRDPFWEQPCLSLPCSLAYLNGAAQATAHPLDARAALRRVAEALASGPAAELGVQCELEFYVFPNVRHSNRGQLAFHVLESAESESPLLEGPPAASGHTLLPGTGRGAAAPQDRFRDVRCAIAAELAEANVQVDRHEHGVGAPGQQRLVLAPLPALAAADAVMLAKYAAKNVAARHGLVATFMPQPLFGDAGSGLLLRLLLGDAVDQAPLLADDDTHGLAPSGWSCLGGVLSHLPGLLALLAPSSSSHRRLAALGPLATRCVCGLGAGWTPLVLRAPTRRAASAIEVPLADASANVYLALAGLLAACVDGLAAQVDLRAEGRCPYQGQAAMLEGSEDLPRSPEAALEALAADAAYLHAHAALEPRLLSAYAAQKLTQELAPLRQRPHPYEMALYLDC